MGLQGVDKLVKKHRLALATKTVHNLLETHKETRIGETLENCVIPMLEWRLASLDKEQGDTIGVETGCGKKVLVACSGGVDSTASLIVACKAGLNPVAITLKLPWGGNSPVNLEKLCKEFGIPLETLGYTEKHLELFEDVQQRGYHPCGRCHSLLVEELYSYAHNVGADLIGFGNMLPTGTHSIRVVGGNLVHVNIPALLALDKCEALAITGFTGRLDYGCNLLRVIHQKHRRTRWVSIQRVFRELRAGCIDAKMAEQFIWDILSA